MTNTQIKVTMNSSPFCFGSSFSLSNVAYSRVLSTSSSFFVFFFYSYLSLLFLPIPFTFFFFRFSSPPPFFYQSCPQSSCLLDIFSLLYPFIPFRSFLFFSFIRDGGAGGAGGGLAPPLLRRMTFYFVLAYGTYKEMRNL